MHLSGFTVIRSRAFLLPCVLRSNSINSGQENWETMDGLLSVVVCSRQISRPGFTVIKLTASAVVHSWEPTLCEGIRCCSVGVFFLNIQKTRKGSLDTKKKTASLLLTSCREKFHVLRTLIMDVEYNVLCQSLIYIQIEWSLGMNKRATQLLGLSKDNRLELRALCSCSCSSGQRKLRAETAQLCATYLCQVLRQSKFLSKLRRLQRQIMSRQEPQDLNLATPAVRKLTENVNKEMTSES